MATEPRWTEERVFAALAHRHPSPAWITIGGLRDASGFSAQRTIDCFAMHTWPSAKFERIAYEIKVSRSDFHREVAHPHKRRSALRFSSKYFFAAPAGLVLATEIPPDCGLVEVFHEYGIDKVRVTLEAPEHSYTPSWSFVAAMLKRVRDQRAEEVRRIDAALAPIEETDGD